MPKSVSGVNCPRKHGSVQRVNGAESVRRREVCIPQCSSGFLRAHKLCHYPQVYPSHHEAGCKSIPVDVRPIRHGCGFIPTGRSGRTRTQNLMFPPFEVSGWRMGWIMASERDLKRIKVLTAVPVERRARTAAAVTADAANMASTLNLQSCPAFQSCTP